MRAITISLIHGASVTTAPMSDETASVIQSDLLMCKDVSFDNASTGGWLHAPYRSIVLVTCEIVPEELTAPFTTHVAAAVDALNAERGT